MGIGAPSLTTNQRKEASTGGAVTPVSIAEALGFFPAPLSYYNEEDVNPEFIIEASCIAFASGAYVFGAPITWGLLDRSSGHGKSFFNAVDSSAQNLKILYPAVRTVLYGNINIDERGSQAGLFAGATVNFDNLEILSCLRRLIGTRFVPDGAGNWSNANSNVDPFIIVSTFGAPGAGETGVQLNFFNADPNNIAVVYAGDANYIINRRYVGTGIYSLVFSLRDAATGALLVANPGANDSVSLSVMTLADDAIRTDIWYTNNFFMSGSGFNYFVTGKFEAWMFVTNVSNTENIVRFQTNYPGATNYRIERDTISTFPAPVTIYSGTAGVFNDTGLTPGTQYFYREIAETPGDVTVTTWAVRTKL